LVALTQLFAAVFEQADQCAVDVAESEEAEVKRANDSLAENES